MKSDTPIFNGSVGAKSKTVFGKLTNVGHITANSIIYMQGHCLARVLRNIWDTTSDLGSPEVVDRRRSAAYVIRSLSTILDEEAVAKILKGDNVEEHRLLEHKLLEQLLLVSKEVSSLYNAKEYGDKSVMALESAVLNLSLCVQSVQRWVNVQRDDSNPSFDCGFSTQSRGHHGAVKYGSLRVLMSVAANALIDIATTRGVAQNYKDIILRYSMMLAAFAGIMDDVQDRGLAQSAENLMDQNVRDIRKVVHSLILDVHSIAPYCSRRKVERVTNKFLNPALDLIDLKLQLEKPIATTPQEHTTRVSVLCDNRVFATLNLAEALYTLKSIEGLYKRNPVLKSIFYKHVSDAKKICKELECIAGDIQGGYRIKGLERMEARAAFSRYASAIRQILVIQNMHVGNHAAITNRLERLLQKASLHVFYSDMMYFRDSPITPEGIVRMLESDDAIPFRESAKESDIVYADVTAILGTGKFVRRGDDCTKAYEQYLNAGNHPDSNTAPRTQMEQLSIGVQTESRLARRFSCHF